MRMIKTEEDLEAHKAKMNGQPVPVPASKPAPPRAGQLPPDAIVGEDTRPPVRSSPVAPNQGLARVAPPPRDFGQSTALTPPYAPQNNTDVPLPIHWVQQEFPSKSIPYLHLGQSSEGIYVRELDMTTLSQVHAAQTSRSLSMLLDALQACIKLDIRKLTVPDFYFFVYWLRMTSYPKTPLHVTWTSKYGNENRTRCTKSDFEIIELGMTPEEYQGWMDMEITFPTMRDFELLQEDDFTEDPATAWLAQYAQYAYIPAEQLTVQDGEVEGETRPVNREEYMELKLQRLKSLGVQVIQSITDFSEAMDHGVLEQVRVRDDKFELDTAIDFVEKEISHLRDLVTAILSKAEENEDLNPQVYASTITLGERVQMREGELKLLKDAKENGTPFEPEEEVVAVQISEAAFIFP